MYEMICRFSEHYINIFECKMLNVFLTHGSVENSEDQRLTPRSLSLMMSGLDLMCD